MAPQTRSAARKQAATTLSQESDLHTNIRPKVAKDNPEPETTPTVSKPRSNPFCMSKERIDRICGYLAYLPVPPKPHARAKQNHSDKLPALLPAELDYLVILLVPFFTPPQSPEAKLMNSQPIDWSTVAANFNDKYPQCKPRKEQVLKCGMRKNHYRIDIAVFRERCRKANAGEDNAGAYGHKASSELDLAMTQCYSRGYLRTYSSFGTR